MKQVIEHFENRAGGKGWIHMEHLLAPEEMQKHVKMYAKVTVDVGASIGYHLHNDDSESYFILRGNAKYTENGIEQALSVGDVTFTPAGSQHGIENIGETPLVFMALIIPTIK